MAHLLWLCEYWYAELEELEFVIATQDFLAFSKGRADIQSTRVGE